MPLFLRRLFSWTPLEAQLHPPLLLPVRFRLFEEPDREACLRLYQKNEPDRFPKNQIQFFEEYINSSRHGFVVTEYNDRVIACGGVVSLADNIHWLCYGLVDPDFHGQRIGTTLTMLRLSMAVKTSGIHFAAIRTVPKSTSFYQRLGFHQRASYPESDGTVTTCSILTYFDSTIARIEKVLGKRNLLPRSNCFSDPSSTLTAAARFLHKKGYAELTFTSTKDGSSFQIIT